MGTREAGQYELDMGTTLVRAGSRANIHVQPQESFQPERLVVPPENSDGFEVDEVGVQGVVLWRGPVPATSLPGEGVSLTSTLVVRPSTFVRVSVANTSSEDRVFRAVVSGPLAN
jgi:hypothetical protein